MAKLWQFSRGHSKLAFSDKKERGNQEKFFKNLHLHFCANSGSKSSRMVKLWAFSQGHSKPAFSEKKERGDQGKFFKNLPKSRPRLKGPKAHLRKWHYPLVSMHLKGKDWRRFWSKKAAPKVPEWPSYGNFGKVTQNPHFLKKCKGGPRETFQKSSKKMPSLKRPTSTLAQMALSSN